MREVTWGGVNWVVIEPSKNGPWFFWDEFEKGNWELDVLEAVDRFVAPCSTFVDVGAWAGPVSMWAADRWDANVLAIEPDPVANDYLHLNVMMNGFDSIAIVDGALSNHTGTTWLAPHETHGWGSTMSRICEDNVGREVPCWSISDLFDEYQLKNVSLVKIDIEGAESIVLETVGPFLAELQIPIIVAIHQPWWNRELDPAWLAGFELSAPLKEWNSVICTPL